MYFIALLTTEDGRLTQGRAYFGNLVYTPAGLRLAIYDNRHEWMTFAPSVFRPVLDPVKSS